MTTLMISTVTALVQPAAPVPLAAFAPWIVTSWPTLTGVLILGIAAIMGSFVFWRQRRSVETAWGEVSLVWQRSLARINALGDLLPDIIFETDENRTLTFANHAFFRITGYCEKDLQAGLNLLDLLEPADRPRLGRDLEAVRSGHLVGVRHYHLRRFTGEAVAVTLRLASIRESGDMRGWRGVLQDVDARRRLATEFRPACSSTESVISGILKDFAQTPVERHHETVDRALATAGCHLGADRCYQYRLREDRLESRRLWYAEGVTPLAEDQRLPGLTQFPWAGERFRRGESVRVSDVGLLPDEARTERERWRAQGMTSLLAVPLLEGDELVGILGCETLGQRRIWDDRDQQLLDSVAEICLRVQRHDRVERRLDEVYRLLGEVVHVLPDPAFVVDVSGRVVAWNTELVRLTGVPATRMTGGDGSACAEVVLGEARLLPVHRLLTDQVATSPLCAHLPIAAPEEVFAPKLRGGRGAYLRLTARVLRDREGRVVGGVQIFQDVTRRRTHRLEFRDHTQELKQRLATTMNELRRTGDARS